MTYNVFGGTLNPTLLLRNEGQFVCYRVSFLCIIWLMFACQCQYIKLSGMTLLRNGPVVHC